MGQGSHRPREGARGARGMSMVERLILLLLFAPTEIGRALLHVLAPAYRSQAPVRASSVLCASSVLTSFNTSIIRCQSICSDARHSWSPLIFFIVLVPSVSSLPPRTCSSTLHKHTHTSQEKVHHRRQTSTLDCQQSCSPAAKVHQSATSLPATSYIADRDQRELEAA